MTSCTLCSTSTTDCPSFATWRMTAATDWTSAAFIPAVGSSSSRRRGDEASARAISTRRWSPYERLETRSRARSQADPGEQLQGGLAGANLVGARRGKEEHAAQRVLPPDQVRADQHVLQRRQAREEPDVLVGAGDAEGGDAVGRQPVDPLASQYDASARRAEQAGDDVEQRGLAGPVGPDQAVHLARGNLDGGSVERAHPAETPLQLLNREQHARPSAAAARAACAAARRCRWAGTGSPPAGWRR